MALTRFKPNLSDTLRCNSINTPVVAAAHVQRTVPRDCQRPDVLRFRSEVLLGVSVADAVDLSVGGGTGVDGAIRRDRDIVKISGSGAVHSNELAAAPLHAIQTAAMSGSHEAVNRSALLQPSISRVHPKKTPDQAAEPARSSHLSSKTHRKNARA